MIKKISITRLLHFHNLHPICIFWEKGTQNWYFKKVIPRLRTNTHTLKFSTTGIVQDPHVYYKFTTCLNYISDVNNLELQHCNKAKFESDDNKTSFIYYLSSSEKVVIPLLPNFDRTKIFFTLNGIEKKPALILRVEI